MLGKGAAFRREGSGTSTDRWSIARAEAERSVLDDLVDAVNHSGDVPTELKEEGPEHLEAGPLLDEDRKERQKETEDDQQDLYHPSTRRSPPGDRVAERLIVLGVVTVGASRSFFSSERSYRSSYI